MQIAGEVLIPLPLQAFCMRLRVPPFFRIFSSSSFLAAYYASARRACVCGRPHLAVVRSAALGLDNEINVFPQ